MRARSTWTGWCSGTFELEWPRGSGRLQQFPELAELAWWSLPDAQPRLIAGQLPFLDRLSDQLAGTDSSHSGR